MVLTGLEADSEYEVRLRAMNRHGWSQLSQPFVFYTSSKYSTVHYSTLQYST